MTFLLLQKCFRAAGPAGLAGRGQVRAAARERVQVPERGGGAHASHPVGPVADGQPARLHAAAESGAGKQRNSPAAVAGTVARRKKICKRELLKNNNRTSRTDLMPRGVLGALKLKIKSSSHHDIP